MDQENQFLVWVKRKLASTRSKDVVNLVSSGVTTEMANAWLADTIANRGELVLQRSSEHNEFGLPSLKQAIRDAFQIPAGREIVTTAGASGGIRLVCELLLAGRRAAEVIIETPVYEPIRAIPKKLGAKITLVERSRGIDAITQFVTENTVAILLSNLHNPTGHWLSYDDLSKLVGRLNAVGSRALIVVDETFSDLGPFPGASAARLGSRILTISSLSKSHGLPSLRCGWVTAEPTAIPNFMRDAVLLDNVGCKFIEILGALAIEQIDAFRQAARQLVAQNRALVSEWLKHAAAKKLIAPQEAPSGCILFVQLMNCRCTRALAELLEARYGVMVAPGQFFGDEYDDHVRIGFGGGHDELKRGLDRLTDGLTGLCL